MAWRNGVQEKTRPPAEVPSNVRLERELLGACFVDDRCGLAFERLHERDFWDAIHARLFNAMKRAWIEKKPFQSSGFLMEVIRDWEPEDRVVAFQILKDGGMPVHIPHYCDGLRELRRKRAIMQIGDELSKAAGDPATNSATWVALCHEWLKKLEAVTP